MAKRLRGSGVRYTLPFIGRFAGLWLIVTITAVLVAAISTYMVFAERLGGAPGHALAQALLAETVMIVVAVVALGIFTTHRLAGPWIAVRRACDAVREGELATRLRIRSSDVHVHAVEEAFNAMLDSLRARQATSGAPR